ncbi:hypothetical protein AB1K84_00640 [Mesobacillus foraminis]|uniref:hypothetical protein n=1 Tax=Mesobacillus foraminis TaxID=279826 RepID=UPI0039A3AEEA
MVKKESVILGDLDAMKTMAEVIKTLENLIYYRDVEIIHNINDISLSYCDKVKAFVLKNMNSGEIQQYADIQTCSQVLGKLLNIS